MKNPKYIIENGNLIISKVDFHKDIATNPKDVIGGGWFDMDYDNKHIRFHGLSTDFGHLTKEQVQKCVTENKVYSNPSCSFSLAPKFNFSFENPLMLKAEPLDNPHHIN